MINLKNFLTIVLLNLFISSHVLGMDEEGVGADRRNGMYIVVGDVVINCTNSEPDQQSESLLLRRLIDEGILQDDITLPKKLQTTLQDSGCKPLDKLIKIAYQLYKAYKKANNPDMMSNLLSCLKLSNEDVSLAYFQMVDENTKMHFDIGMKDRNEGCSEPIQLLGKLDDENFEAYKI